MSINLPPLPFALDALAPIISEETLHYHYDKHHRGYVNRLNTLIQGTEFESQSLREIVVRSSGKIYNNAAQAWNHEFFWNCLTPHQGQVPDDLRQKIEERFSSLTKFKDTFSARAVELFGSGWAWLTLGPRRELSIETLSNAGNPLRSGKFPLFTLDVWEHAYYIDYRNDRKKFVSSIWDLVNWETIAKNLDDAQTAWSQQTTKGNMDQPPRGEAH